MFKMLFFFWCRIEITWLSSSMSLYILLVKHQIGSKKDFYPYNDQICLKGSNIWIFWADSNIAFISPVLNVFIPFWGSQLTLRILNFSFFKGKLQYNCPCSKSFRSFKILHLTTGRPRKLLTLSDCRVCHFRSRGRVYATLNAVYHTTLNNMTASRITRLSSHTQSLMNVRAVRSSEHMSLLLRYRNWCSLKIVKSLFYMARISVTQTQGCFQLHFEAL